MIRPLGRVLVMPPRVAFRSAAFIEATWETLNYLGPPEMEASEEEFESFERILVSSGAEVVRMKPDEQLTLDAIYPRDAAIITESGAILCAMGKAARRSEPGVLRAQLGALGIPTVGQIQPPGTLEGGDVVWMDERRIAVGEGYRSNAEGIRQLRDILGDTVDEMIIVPLPHWNGPGDVLHLMSLVSPVDGDLYVLYPRLLPVPFLHRLAADGIDSITVPDAEFDSMACNVLTVAPRQVIMLDGNPKTKRLLEDRNVQVTTYRGEEISRKGCGGPTCLTLPLARLE